MTKPLSELLAEIGPNQHLPESQFVDVASYIKTKAIAVELAKCVEYFEIRHDSSCDILYVDRSCSCSNTKYAQFYLTKARSILEGGE